MKGGGFLVLLFLLFCFLWGVSSIFGGIRKTLNPSKAPQPLPLRVPDRFETAAPTPAQMQISELESLFALHQGGALMRDEFEQLKHQLLNPVIPTKSQGVDRA